MTMQETRPPGKADPRAGAAVPEKELSEWAGSRSIYLRIAAALARRITEEGWDSWRPVPVNPELARIWDCSPDTAARAKRLLRERGVLVCENRAYYVA